MLRGILLIFGISCGYYRIFVNANGLPASVQFGGAIVAAVEADAEQEEERQEEQQQLELELEQRKQFELQVAQFWQFLSRDFDWTQIARWFTEIEEGRGKHHKRQKMLKYLYPLLVGVLIAKTVLVPLILKMLTALSTSSFVMSKIALVTSGFLALKWIFGGGAETAKRLEIVHIPALIPVGKATGINGGAGGWDDMAWSGSNFVDIRTKQLPHNYIPVAVGGGGAGTRNAAGVSLAIPSSYRYPQHNYDAGYAGRPFL